MKKRYSDEQIVGFLREAESGMSVSHLLLRNVLGRETCFPPTEYQEYCGEPDERSTHLREDCQVFNRIIH